MPIYVYKNINTGETFEIEQRITEAALKVHPKTGEPVIRLIQPVGIAFKGSGFYVNDSRGSSKTSTPATSSTSTETKTETKAETKNETKSEPKPVAKTESKSSST
jgi:predicted nucleic acid-binding Zn ribbon protein